MSNLYRTKRFFPLFVTQFAGAFNDNAFKNAFLIWFTYDLSLRTGQDPVLMSSIAAGLFILPFFLFSAFAGQLADKYDKAQLTVKIKAIEIVLMCSAIASFYFESVNGLLFVLFAMGAQSTFFGPIKYSLLPEHLHDDELLKGNAIVEAGSFIAILLGTLIGGLIINLENGLLIIGVLLLGCALIGFFSSRSIPKAKIQAPNISLNWNVVASTHQLIRYAATNRTVFICMMAISWFWLIGALFLMQFPSLGKNVLQVNEQVVTLFLTLFSVGIAIGSMLSHWLQKGEISTRFVAISGAFISISIFSFCFFCAQYQAPQSDDLVSVTLFLSQLNGIGIVISLLLLSIFSGIYIVPLYAMMQHVADGTHIARVIAATNVMNSFFMVIASLFAISMGILGLSIVSMLTIIGIINLLVCLLLKRYQTEMDNPS